MLQRVRLIALLFLFPPLILSSFAQNVAPDSLKGKTLQAIEIQTHRNQTPSDFLPTQILEGFRLEAIKGNSLGQLLTILPGVTSLQTGPTISKPVIRGLQGTRIATYVNGIRLEGQQWGNEHAPEADPMLFSEIAVIKGAATVRYGTEASAGAIILEPEVSRPNQPFKLTVGTLAASNGRQWGNQIKINKSLGKNFYCNAMGSYKNSGNVASAQYIISNSNLRELTGFATIGYANDFWGLQFSQSAFYNKIGIFPGAHIGNVTDLLRAISASDTIYKASFSRSFNRPYQEINHFISQFKFWYLFPKAGKLTFNLARQYNERSEFDLHRPFRIANPTAPELSFKLKTHTADLLFQTAHNQHIETEYGLQLTTQGNVVQGRILIPNFRSYFAGVFALHRYHFNEWNLELGSRYDFRTFTTYSNEGGIISSQIKKYQGLSAHTSLYRKIGIYQTIRLNAQTAFRAPNVNELFSEGVHHGSAAYEKGNASLRSERSFGSQVTYQFQNNILNFKAESYFTHYRSFIYLQPQNPETILTIRGAFPLFNWAQFNINMMGIESELSILLPNNWTINTTASLQRNRNVSDNNWLVFSPANRYQLFVIKSFELNNKNTLFIEPSALVVSRQNLFPKDQDFANPPPGYFLLNAQAGYSHKGKAITQYYYLSGNNLTNTAYKDYLNRMRYFIQDLGRNIQVRVVFEFNNHS